MTARLLSFRLPDWPALAAGVVLAGAAVAAPLAAQTYTYARSMNNDLNLCAPGAKGPAVRVTINGLKSGDGNLFVRAYPARASDWLESKRYVMRVDARPQKGSMTVCVPLPATGDFAIAVQHDANGNRKTDVSTDGAGMSNNPGIKKILGLVPRPPSVDKVRFRAGEGITRMTINMQYL
ncbi:DUF2141 domain-containing protein [Erythrobacter sp. BLCC-B19]|uniref:DUF2141 domain-containing protein n=1 Tax=Erythrobacter sp. BLCC-B19 TaxID=3025315 RepID=UPI0023625E73|nr:DUF2141 domain-containing protein [Erythrobacter sp. BLCC-B19]WDA42213.1 DUF2141 domain-containing protein [Erythrobacter sp. BLCC-B19]